LINNKGEESCRAGGISHRLSGLQIDCAGYPALPRNDKGCVKEMNKELDFKGNILVADDEKVNVEFFQVMLSKLGFMVETAYNGDEVFEKLKEFTPDLIVLDLLMPGMSGFEVAKRLKESSRTSEIPSIVLTAVSDIKDKVDMLELGIEDYIIKPFNFIEILARIRNVLRVGTLREELKSYEKKLEYVEDFRKALSLFLENSESLLEKIVKSGEKELKKKFKNGDSDRDNSLFTQNVVETGKTHLESIANMKCKYRELVLSLEE
jgi:DNA-binding response OmpR family regulator